MPAARGGQRLHQRGSRAASHRGDVRRAAFTLSLYFSTSDPASTPGRSSVTTGLRLSPNTQAFQRPAQDLDDEGQELQNAGQSHLGHMGLVRIEFRLLALLDQSLDAIEHADVKDARSQREQARNRERSTPNPPRLRESR